MKRFAFGALPLLVALLLAGCDRAPSSCLQVTATTSIMADVIQNVGKDRVSVTALVAPASCPGHYDVRPGDVYRLNRSAILFTHGYEQFLPGLLASVEKPGPRVCRVAVEGNWLVPARYRQAVREAARQLSLADPRGATEYRRAATAACARATALEGQLRRQLRPLVGERVPVFCADQLASLLRWMGLDVVGTYGRPDDFTPVMLHRLVERGRGKRVRLVVDNLQSGPAAGSQLAAELGAQRVMLSNFPGGLPNTRSWEQCLRRDVELVQAALAASREKR